MQAASDAGEPVTRHEPDIAVGGLKAQLAALEARLSWRLISAMVALAGVIIAAAKLIP